MQEGATRDSTHRTRSLFFVASAACIAQAWGVDAVRFFENGVVSLNLPPSGQATGTRATRSTHPQALALFSELLSTSLGRELRVDNPFFWKTKTDVVELIRSHGAADLVRHSRSCADVRNMIVKHSHRGLCSQCIDRRVAMLAAGMSDEDPIEAYEVDPLFGPRVAGPDREIAFGYVHNARGFAEDGPEAFLRRFGEVSRAAGFFEGPDDANALRLHELHRRHGAAVTEVARASLRWAMEERGRADPQSLVALMGQAQLGAPVETPPPALIDAATAERVMVLRVAEDGAWIEASDLGRVTGALASLIAWLAGRRLAALGKGIAPEDQPLFAAREIADALGIEEPTVRRRISRLRRDLDALATAKGRNPLDEDAVIENIPWGGYRLNPTRLRVEIAAAGPRAKRQSSRTRPSSTPMPSISSRCRPVHTTP